MEMNVKPRRTWSRSKAMREKGFTLIELLVVIGIMAIIGGVASDLFVSILKGANKASVINEVKQNGNLVLDILERNIRNSKNAWLGGLDSKVLVLEDQNGNYIQFHIWQPTSSPVKNGYIAMATGTTLKSDTERWLVYTLEKELTNTDLIGGVSVIDGSFTVVAPTPPSINPTYISISFQMAQGEGAPSRKDYTIGGSSGLTFQTMVSLRTY